MDDCRHGNRYQLDLKCGKYAMSVTAPRKPMQIHCYCKRWLLLVAISAMLKLEVIAIGQRRRDCCLDGRMGSSGAPLPAAS